MEKKNNKFFKEYAKSIKDLDDPEITEQEIEYNNIYATGAYRVYQILRKWLIGQHWKDTKGYPMKEKFYDRGLLACSVSIRKLSIASGFSDKKTQLLIKQLKEGGWIKTGKTNVARGQKVYILGYWKGNNKKTYKEHLYCHKLLNIEEDVLFESVYTKFDFPDMEKTIC